MVNFFCISRITPMHFFVQDIQSTIRASQQKFPNSSLPQLQRSLEEKTRSISPLLLLDPPYFSSDTFFIKCVKSVQSIMVLLLHLTGDTIQQLGLLNQLKRLPAKAIALEKEIFKNYFESQDLLLKISANEEKLKVIRGESNEINRKIIIELFINSYQTVLNTRRFYLEGDEKVQLDPSKKTELLRNHRSHLEKRLTQFLTSFSRGESVDEIESEIAYHRQIYDHLLRRKTEMTEVLHEYEEFCAQA